VPSSARRGGSPVPCGPPRSPDNLHAPRRGPKKAQAMIAFTAPGPISTVAFLFICAAVLAAFFAGVYESYRRSGLPAFTPTLTVAGATLVWLALLSVPVAAGVLEERPMPRLMLFFLAANLAALFAGLSPLGRRLAALPLPALVLFQAFRLPLELVLHAWAVQGAIPVTMTWSGANFDVVTGLAALVFAPLASRSRAAAWAVNLIGIALLLNVGRVAVLSSPLPFAWNVAPPLTLAFHLPYAWIGPVCVAGALLGHVVLTRALLRR